MAAIANLTVRISAQIGELQKSFTDVKKGVDQVNDQFKGLNEQLGKSGSTFDKFAQQAASMAAGMLTANAAMAAAHAVWSGITSVIQTAIGLVRSAIQTVVDAVKHTIEVGDQLFTLSQKTGVSVEALSALRYVAGQTGASLEDLSAATFKMQVNLGKGGKDTTNALNDLGLSLKNLRDANPADAFGAILGKLGEIPNATLRAQRGAEIFGKSFQSIAQLTQEDLGALIKEAEELGVIMSTETAVAADRFGDALGRINAKAEALQFQIGAALLPGIIAFTETIETEFKRAIDNVGLSSAGLATLVDAAVIQIGKAAASLIRVVAYMVDALVQWGAGKFLQDMVLLEWLAKVTQHVLLLGRAWDSTFGHGVMAGTLDVLERQAQDLRNFSAAAIVTVSTAATTLHILADTTAKTAAGIGANFAETYRRIQAELATTAAKMKKTQQGMEGDFGSGLSALAEKAKAFWKETGILETKLTNLERVMARADIKRQLGPDIDKVVQLALELGIAFDKLPPKIRAFADERAADRFAASLKRINEVVRDTLTASFSRFGAAVHKVFEDDLAEVLEQLRLRRLEVEAFRTRGTQDTPPVPFLEPIPVSWFEHAFGNFGEFAGGLSNVIGDALMRGDSVIAAAAQHLGRTFQAQFANALQKAGGDLSKVSTTSKSLALAGAGLEAFFSGYNMGEALGTKTKGALAGGASGALSGAAIGTMIAPGIGTAIGAVVGGAAGLIGGFFGGRSAEKKAKAALAESKAALLEQFGGMEKLKKLAEKLGVNIQAAFDAKKPEQFQAAVDKLNKAIEGQNKRLEGLQKAVDGVNTRAQIFGQQFAKAFEAGDTAKLAEIAQRAQPEFERLGLMVRDTFAGVVKETGSAYAAIQQMAPAFQTLADGVDKFGLTSTAVIDELLANFRLVTDEGLKPFFDAIYANGQVLQGLFDAKALSPEGFQAIAADIGQSIQSIVERGGDMARTLALSQPVLQTLWEAQQRYGAITDQTTQSILNQAEEQGLVGAHMKETNKQILDVLLAIGKVLGADLPDYFRKLKAPAEEAAQGIEDAFTDIDVPPIDIPYQYQPLNNVPGGLPELGAGGIVKRPTLALIGESGPEAVVPLSGSALGASGSYVTNIYLDGERIAQSTATRLPHVLRTMGV